MGLPEGISFDQVIPLLAISFGSQGQVEDAVLAEFSDQLYETPMWRLVEEAVEFGHLLPEEIHSEFGAFFRDELSQASWSELRAVDREFLQAAALGDASSLWILGLRLVRAAIAAVDSDEQEDLDEDGLFLFVEAAEAGDARAQWMLGERFSRMQDGLDESVRLLGMAAAQGFDRAATRLEELFERRYTFVHGPSETKWLRRFARAGVVTAQFDLANDLYLQGDPKAAFAWMLQAAKAAHVPAQQRLAFYYEVGEGCSRNLQRADYWRNFSTRVAEPEAPSIAEVEESEELSASPVELCDESRPRIEVDALEEIPVAEVEELPETEICEEIETEFNQELASNAEDADPSLEPEIPTLTVDEELLEAEEIPAQDDVGLTEKLQHPEAELEQAVVNQSKTFDQPSAPAKQRTDLASRFRSGLAGVLRRLADKVSGSPRTAERDDD